MKNRHSVLLKEGKLGTISPLDKKLASIQMKESPLEHFNELTGSDIKELMAFYMNSKEALESLVAVRHNYTVISHRFGHNGVSKEGEYFEVKNNFYSSNGFSLSLPFDRLSESNFSKFKNDRPTIILNGTKDGAIIYEIKIEFGDNILSYYKEKLDLYPKGNLKIPFSVFKENIIDCYYKENLKDYKGTNALIEYIYTKTGKDLGLTDKYKRYIIGVCENKEIRKILAREMNLTAVGRHLSKKTGIKISGLFVKQLLLQEVEEVKEVNANIDNPNFKVFY